MRRFCCEPKCPCGPVAEAGSFVSDELPVSAPALPVPDAEECHWMLADYEWSLCLRLFDDAEGGWRTFQQGYLAGGEIARRRYGNSLRSIGPDVTCGETCTRVVTLLRVASLHR